MRVCVCLLCIYTCVLLFLGTRSVSGRVRTCSFDLCLWLRACSLKAAACRHAFVCVCVQMQARWWVCVCELGLWWHGRSVPNVTACWGGVESEGWQRWASCPHTVYPAAAQGSPANLKGPKESPPKLPWHPTTPPPCVFRKHDIILCTKAAGEVVNMDAQTGYKLKERQCKKF